MARDIVNIMLFNMCLVYTNRLWEPETKDLQGNPMETPQYSATIIVPKTKAGWHEEPALQQLGAAMFQVYQQQMAPAGIQQQYVEWNVKDGDRPNTKGKIPDWAKGNWIVRAGTGYKPEVSGVVDGREVEFPTQSIGGRKFYEDGDFAALAIGVTVSSANPSRIKLYCNSVLFTGKGKKISTGGGGVSAAEMMAAARAQGVNVTGISGAAQFGGTSFGGQQQQPGGGFNPGGAGPGPGVGGGFNPGGAGPGPGVGGGFNPGGQQQQQQQQQQQPGGGFNPGGQQQPGGGFNPGGAGPGPGVGGGFNPGGAGPGPGVGGGFNPA